MQQVIVQSKGRVMASAISRLAILATAPIVACASLAFAPMAHADNVRQYGQSVTFGSWVCSSEETGMTCRNTETGHGVFLSSGRYETF